MSRHVRLRWLVALLTASVALVASGNSALYGKDSTASPSLRLVAAVRETTISRYGDQQLFGQLGTYVASVGGPFDLRVRPVGGDFDVRQVVPGHEGRVREVRRLPAGVVGSLDEGLRSFFDVSVFDERQNRVAQTKLAFCPAGFERGRIDDSGPDVARYPATCWNSPLTQAAVWGIDRGWSVAAPDNLAGLDLADGHYTARLAISPRYVQLFGIEPAKASVTVGLVVKTDGSPPPCTPIRPCPPPCPPGHPCPLAATSRPGPVTHGPGEASPVPAIAADASGVPDLVALPASGFEARHDDQTNRDVVDFSATVWNAGRGPMVVEGFRRPGTDEMDAFQYLFTNGRRTGSFPAGTLVYDAREGHQHWHFKDFARYQLLDTSGNVVVRSGKEAFCIAPTDAVDLTVRGADWNPGATGLQTACGGESAVWIREVLQAGWGDTYFQSLPGQSFDVTDVANGTYVVEVTTNPAGHLREQTAANNTAYRTITLGGVGGARSVGTP